MATAVPDITERAANQDDITAPAAGAVDTTVTSTVSSILLGLFIRQFFVAYMLTEARDDVVDRLENWRVKFCYLLPVVVIETIWNVTLVVASVVILIWSAASKETNVSSLRVWISVYSLQCVVYVVLRWKEYGRRNSTNAIPTQISPYRRWELTNTWISYLWSVIGIGLIVNIGWKFLLHDDPRLFWLALAFLASSELFVMCMLILLCYPILICLHLMFYEQPQKRASENDIGTFPKYTFEMSNGEGQNDRAGRSRMIRMETNDPASSNVIPTNDVDFCICIGLYENGSELHSLQT